MNKKNILFYMMLIASFLLPPTFAHAAFEQTGTGARGTALGDNYASMGDDVLSLMYNPAELARVRQKEIGTEYSRLYTGLSDESKLSQYYMGYGQPVKWGGTLAIGIKQFSLDDLYKERTISLGYGEWLTPTIAIGGAVKQLYHSFGIPTMIVDDNGNVQSGTPSFFAANGNSNTAYSADLGVLYRMTDRHTLGISVQDVNEPNIALNPADHEVVPRTVRLSMAYEAQRRLTLAGGLMTREGLSGQKDYTWTGSAEKWWKIVGGDEVAVRGALATGSRSFQQATMGAGYKFKTLEVDYAFVFNLTGVTPGSTMGTHRFSLTYRFGEIGKPVIRSQKTAKQRAPKAMPEGYETRETQPQTQPQGGLPRSADVTVKPEGADRYRAGALPHAAEISITAEDIEDSSPAPKAVEIQIYSIIDTDFDGVMDDHDLCPDSPAGQAVDANGCAQTQVDHHGNPLPRKAKVQFLPLEEVEFGHQ